MKIKMKIIPNDTEKVAKVVILDSEDKVLMLKRSNYVLKFAKEWDLPGGHGKKGESLIETLRREVKEETGLSLNSPKFIKKIGSISFFYDKYTNEPIELSHEHTDFLFFPKNKLNKDKKFENVAIEVINKQGN